MGDRLAPRNRFRAGEFESPEALWLALRRRWYRVCLKVELPDSTTPVTEERGLLGPSPTEALVAICSNSAEWHLNTPAKRIIDVRFGSHCSD